MLLTIYEVAVLMTPSDTGALRYVGRKRSVSFRAILIDILTTAQCALRRSSGSLVSSDTIISTSVGPIRGLMVMWLGGDCRI